MDMRMTESAAWMIGLMGFLVVVVGAVLVVMRVYGGRAAHDDHPHAPAAEQRAIAAGAPARATPALSAQRGGDTVEDVALGHDQ